jgi:S1-C subfamily serine protease
VVNERSSPVALAALLVLGGSCAPVEPGAACGALIYGDDDRAEVFEHGDALASLTRASVVALIPAASLDVSDPTDVFVAAPTLGDAEGLCADEPYADQPSAAFCSGVLIDDDLVLTAGHCLSNDDECRATKFVFGFYYEGPGVLATIGSSAVLGCRRIVAREEGDFWGGDFAVVQLDRGVGAERLPVNPSDERLARGDPLTVIGHGTGIPAKIDDGAFVVDPRDGIPAFHIEADTFRGSSGSGVFDPFNRLVGIVTGGRSDFVDRCGCRAIRRLPTGDGMEEAVRIRPVIDELCAQGWSSARLCG